MAFRDDWGEVARWQSRLVTGDSSEISRADRSKISREGGPGSANGRGSRGRATMEAAPAVPMVEAAAVEQKQRDPLRLGRSRGTTAFSLGGSDRPPGWVGAAGLQASGIRQCSALLSQR